MGCLCPALAMGHISRSITTVKASTPNGHNTPTTTSGKRATGGRRTKGRPPSTLYLRRKQQEQPSVSEVESAIDVEPRHGGTSDFFDLLASTPIGQPEGEAERKLREIGEWIIENAEGNPRTGYEILVVVSLYILPVWMCLLLVASGIIKLPFDVPFLDDLIM